MNRIALLFDRTYIDAQHCFMEPAIQFAKKGFGVDLYMVATRGNHSPFFEDQNIRILPFPISKVQRADYWSKIFYSRDRKYKAIIGTAGAGAWVAYKTAKIQKIPYYYLADELIAHLANSTGAGNRNAIVKKDLIANRYAAATIALGQERYEEQKQLNKITYPHEYFVIPNAPSGDAIKLKSNYYRDVFNIEDRKPILFFAGTLHWLLAQKIFQETKTYSDRPYHIVFQTRTVGLMEKEHPFIKMSQLPIPSIMMNYAVSSTDIGLALYDKNSEQESRNGFTGGKIGTYLKNQLPLIVGSVENMRFFEENQVGLYWNGETAFDEIAIEAINNMQRYKENIPAFYKANMQYEYFFEKLYKHVLSNIKA
jgi:hypothetical protein